MIAPVGSNAAAIFWKQETLANVSGEDLWPVLREIFIERRIALDAACQAASTGPIRFDLAASHGIDQNGQRYTNNSFNSIFHVTLPDSGRSQTQKGP